jgi:hypothetical protein
MNEINDKGVVIAKCKQNMRSEVSIGSRYSTTSPK